MEVPAVTDAFALGVPVKGRAAPSATAERFCPAENPTTHALVSSVLQRACCQFDLY